MFLIENPQTGERQCVEALSGYEDWTVLRKGKGAAPPDEEAVWEKGQWTVPLGVLCRRQLSWAKDEMERERGAGLPTQYGEFDVDLRSQASLSVALSAAGDDFSVDWTLRDNSVATLSRGQLLEVCRAAQEKEADLHKRLQRFRQKLASCRTAKEVEALRL